MNIQKVLNGDCGYSYYVTNDNTHHLTFHVVDQEKETLIIQVETFEGSTVEMQLEGSDVKDYWWCPGDWLTLSFKGQWSPSQGRFLISTILNINWH